MQTTPETEVPQSMTEEQGAQELLKRWGVGDTPEPEKQETADETPEAEPEQSQDDAQDEEVEDADDSAQSDEVVIDVGGEKFKIPPVLAEEAKRIETGQRDRGRCDSEVSGSRRFAQSRRITNCGSKTIAAAIDRAG